MLRIVLASLILTSSFTLTGCCSTCGGGLKKFGCVGCGEKSGGGCCGYWRNLGQPGIKPVGCATCRKCDLCEDVGGPCGGWARTSLDPGMSMDGADGYYEDEVIMEAPVAPSHSRMTRQGTLRTAPRRVVVRPVRTTY